jgi:hypothetical protein
MPKTAGTRGLQSPGFRVFSRVPMTEERLLHQDLALTSPDYRQSLEDNRTTAGNSFFKENDRPNFSALANGAVAQAEAPGYLEFCGGDSGRHVADREGNAILGGS